MSETENLILCIESHPCLWDTSNEDYHDKEKKISAWLEICNMLTQDWDTLTEDERRSKSQELKKKWNNCRDYYKKNKQKRGRRSRYVYADILSFLDKVDKKNHEENDDTADYLELEVLETTEDDDDEEWETQKAVEDIKNEFKHKNTNRQPAPKKRKLQHVPDEISNVTSKNYTASKDNDDDKNFLLSFSSDMKRMTHRQKIEFKLAMMQLLKDTFTENANSPPYYRDASMSEPPKLIYSDPVMYQEDAKSSLAQSRFRLTPSTDQRHSKQRKN